VPVAGQEHQERLSLKIESRHWTSWALIGGGGKTKTKAKSFEERIEELEACKAKHGHVRVTVRHDQSFAKFSQNTRAARRGTGRMPIIDNRIKALDELGFDWGDKTKAKSVEEV